MSMPAGPTLLPPDPRGSLHIAPVGGRLDVAEAHGRLIVEEVPKHKVYRVFHPPGSPAAVCQEDEALVHKYGDQVDGAMNRIKERFANEKGLNIKVLYLDGEVVCSPVDGGPDVVVWLETEDPDFRELRRVFTDAGWKPEHWVARSAFIKGNNNGVVPFQKTTERLKRSKGKLKQALFGQLTVAERREADVRIARFQRFKQFYPTMIHARKLGYERARDQANNNQQKDYYNRMIAYCDKALAQFDQMDDDTIEMALIRPIGVGEATLTEALTKSGETFQALKTALEAEDGPKMEGLKTSLSRIVPNRFGGDKLASGFGNALTSEEAQWLGELTLFSVCHPETSTERAIYDGTQYGVETQLAPLKLLPEERMALSETRRNKLTGDLPQLKATQDTLDSAIFKFIVLGPTEDVMNHPSFKVLWDGFPASGNHAPHAFIPPQESAQLRQALVQGYHNNFP